MNLSYVFLVALLISTTAVIYGTYLYMLDKSKDFHTEDVAIAIKTLLDLEPGQSKIAHIAIPEGTTLKICPDKECRCGAPTCILVIGPTHTAMIGTTAEVMLVPHQSPQTLYAGTYTIKAYAAPPDLEKITICRTAYQIIADTQKLISKGCTTAVDDIISELETLVQTSTGTSAWLSELIQPLREKAYELCSQTEDVSKFIYSYLCVSKKIYLEITTT